MCPSPDPRQQAHSLQSEKSASSSSQPERSETGDTTSYSAEERQTLIGIAHQSIEAALQGRQLDLAAPSAHLAERRGAFTTLHLHGALRGCIGHIFPDQPLYRTVADTARAAAFDDPRFAPLTSAEAPELAVEISVLSVPLPIRPDDIVVGKHGLVVAQGSHRGLLLPQVPLEWNWDRETFLAQTCLKAGLPPDAWRRGAQLHAFTAEVFGEDFHKSK